MKTCGAYSIRKVLIAMDGHKLQFSNLELQGDQVVHAGGESPNQSDVGPNRPREKRFEHGKLHLCRTIVELILMYSESFA